MFKIKHSTMIFLSGLVWFIVGCSLLSLGLNFIISSILAENLTVSRPILDRLAPLVGGLDQAALVWISICVMIGLMKGRFIFAKSVHRSVKRIATMPNPAPISQIYPLSYYILLASMMFLGFIVRFASIDLRGGVDVIVGFALTTGALLYFRQAWAARLKPAYL